MVGDRLYTDIEMANRAGVKGVLVLSGEATLEDLEQSPQKPDLVVNSIDEMLR
jgi:NagD protein